MAGFNENLSEKRMQRGLSQKAMAEAIGVAQSTYSLYEKGAREPNISKIVKISEVLNISIDDLFGTEPVVDELLESSSVPIAVQPNAGLPKVIDGKTVGLF